MNKVYRIIYSICILIIALSFVSCKNNDQEKEVLHIDGSMISVNESMWLETADLIFKGRVLEKKEPYFTNPNNDKLCKDGSHAVNSYVTEYIVAIDQLYKGSWESDTIAVKAYNKQFLTVEQALYGEDDNTIVIDNTVDTEMQMGECIVGLSYFDASEAFADDPCYEITFGMAGYFLGQEDGTYINQTSGNNQFSIDPQTLPDKIAALE